MSIAAYALLAGITFVAGMVQGAIGFGSALLVLPFYLLILDSLSAIQTTIAVTLAISLLLVPGLWRQAPRPLLTRLLVGTIAGLPLGLLAFLAMSLDLAKLITGVLISALGFFLLFRKTAPAPQVSEAPKSAVVIGVVSGAMTASLAMPGPAVMLYLQAVGATKATARATTLTQFLVAYAAALAIHARFGDMTGATWATIGLLVPPALAGALIGSRLAASIGERTFRNVVLVILIATGLYTLISVIPAV